MIMIGWIGYMICYLLLISIFFVSVNNKINHSKRIVTILISIMALLFIIPIGLVNSNFAYKSQTHEISHLNLLSTDSTGNYYVGVMKNDNNSSYDYYINIDGHKNTTKIPKNNMELKKVKEDSPKVRVYAQTIPHNFVNDKIFNIGGKHKALKYQVVTPTNVNTRYDPTNAYQY